MHSKIIRLKNVLGALVLTAGIVVGTVCAASVYELRNNQPFPLRAPVKITEQQALPDGVWKVGGDTLAQSQNGELYLVTEIPASGEKRFVPTQVVAGATGQKDAALAASASGGSVSLQFDARDLGRLSWSLVLQPLEVTAKGTARPVKLPLDYKAEFSALPLDFQKTASGPVFDLWKGTADKNGLVCTVVLRVYHAGFLDIETSLANRSADAEKKVYCALVCRWEQPETPKRTLDYDNHITELEPAAYSPFRLGTERHLFIQRGADWIRSDYKSGVSVVWMNEFSDSFTLLDESSRNTFKQSRYVGGSLPQLGQEIQTAERAIYSITEIARPNIRSYSPDRIFDNVLPAKGDGVQFASRMVFARAPLDDVRTTQQFLGYSSVRSQSREGDATRVTWGVPHVRFGTAYFPYSTLGENFDRKKLPGMDREAFWPLAADTVLRWREFADEIKRDLRLAKGMGFELIRLHHIELLSAIPDDTRREYLDFLFDEMRHLGLKVMVDVYGTPESIAELVRRYGDIIDTVEIENEILIWGIPLDRPKQWAAIYRAVKEVAPHVRVHLTCHTNTAIFERLDKLGVPYDNVSMHTYIDSVDALPSGRGFALGTASRATKENKPAVVTEWNWRNVTRLAPEKRAKFTYDVFDSALATRSISEMHEFQFQETMCPNPRAGRGNILRHYELLTLSRRLKLEAFAFMDLIKKYTRAGDSVRLLDAPPAITTLNPKGAGSAEITLTNTTAKPMRLKLALETSADFRVKFREGQAETLELAPGQSAAITLDVQTTAAAPAPGFYHGFLRIEGSDALLRYTWIEGRLHGKPRFDTTAATGAVVYPRGVAKEVALNFRKPIVVAYTATSSVLEAETAIAIANTLESATGMPIEALSAENITAEHIEDMTIIAVGTTKQLGAALEQQGLAADTLPQNLKSYVVAFSPEEGHAPRALFIGGNEARDVEDAGMDFLLRYWQHAKDSVSRRVGLVEKELPRGGNPVKLP